MFFSSSVLQLLNQGTVAYASGGLVRDVKNKAVLCKPLTLTKATYCKPHMQSKLLQTGIYVASWCIWCFFLFSF